MKKLSIVTALYDSDEAIFETSSSVLPQLNDEVEWFIKNSTTEPSAALKEMAAAHPNVILYSEQDSSIYQGLNQALGRLNGVYYQVLGAGDSLTEGAVAQMLNAIDQNESKFKMDSIFFPVYHQGLKKQLIPIPAQIQDAMNCPHPGALLKTKLCQILNGFNEWYLIAADYELIGRYLKQWSKVMVGQHTVVSFSGGGMSETRGYECMLETELVKVRIFGKKPY